MQICARPRASASNVDTRNRPHALLEDLVDVTETEWVLVADAAEIPEEGALGLEVRGSPVCLARSGGRLYAVKDQCTHEDVPLSEGYVEDGVIECFRHGSQFELATGRVLNLPALKNVAVFPVRVDGPRVYVAVPKQHP